MASNIFDVLDAWDLLDNTEKLGRYNMRDWQRIEEALDRIYTAAPAPVLGSVSLGLSDAAQMIEGHAPLSKIAPYLLAFPCVWLPDPVYSFVSRRGAAAWQRMPEAGSTFFAKQQGIHTQRKVLWTAAPAERLALLRATLPAVLFRLKEMRPLVEMGAVRIAPWEPIVSEYWDAMRDDVAKLTGNKTIKAITEKNPQIQYNLGIYLGAMGIEASPGQPEGSQLTPGDLLWLDDKTPMAVYGLTNAAYCAATGAAFAPSLNGDRDMYEFVMSEGSLDPPRRVFDAPIALPRFSEALIPEVASVRADSETLAILRNVVHDVASNQEDAVLPQIEERLRHAAAQIRSDTAVWRLVANDFTEVAL